MLRIHLFTEKYKNVSYFKKRGTDFLHLFNSFNRHLVKWSWYCAVHNGNLAEKILQKNCHRDHILVMRDYSMVAGDRG